MNITGQQVVLDDAAILGAVAADDRVILLVHQPGPSLGSSPLHVSRALGLDHLPGHAQPDPAVGHTSATGDHVVGVLGGDLIAEEPRRAGAGVGDQRLRFGQLQLEVIAQELSEAMLDLLGLCLRSGEPEQDVIGVSRVTQPPVAGIVGILAREAALLLAQRPHRGMVAAAAGSRERVLHPCGTQGCEP